MLLRASLQGPQHASARSNLHTTLAKPPPSCPPCMHATTTLWPPPSPQPWPLARPWPSHPHPLTPSCSVHIITDFGRPTGIALVEFSTPADAQTALAKDKQMMGTRYIEIFMSSKDELQRYLPRSY